MAQLGVQLYRETFSCSICLDLLKDPVTVPCGHSYCKDCIKTHWDSEDRNGLSSNSCPQCRQSFDTRPVLVKNTMLADLVEELKKTGVQAAPADHCYAGPEDVACDFCTGRKLKAIKSCLVCVASYCEEHLQPHYELPVFKKHKLVEPSKKLQENDTVSAAAESTERHRELEGSRLNIQQRITDVEKDVKLLQQEVEAINGSADKAVEHSEKTFAEMIRQVRSKQKTEVSRVRDLQEKLEQEIPELKRRDAELKTLAQHEDHNQFLQDYRSLSQLSESTHSYSINIRPLRYFEDVTAAVSEAREKLQDVLKETWINISWTNISLTETPVDVLLPQPEPKTRADFLRYSRDITLDPNTAHTLMLLSKGTRKATFMTKSQSYPNHPDRFTNWPQVLSKESLTGCCYWEVKWRGPAVLREGGVVNVAVSYKNIIRACSNSKEGGFGLNDKSWALECAPDSYSFSHNDVRTPVSGPLSSRIGVYLDHSAGVLSFYSVSRTMTLLHRVQTTFTQPLHAGVYIWERGDTAEFSKLK